MCCKDGNPTSNCNSKRFVLANGFLEDGSPVQILIDEDTYANDFAPSIGAVDEGGCSPSDLGWVCGPNRVLRPDCGGKPCPPNQQNTSFQQRQFPPMAQPVSFNQSGKISTPTFGSGNNRSPQPAPRYNNQSDSNVFVGVPNGNPNQKVIMNYREVMDADRFGWNNQSQSQYPQTQTQSPFSPELIERLISSFLDY